MTSQHCTHAHGHTHLSYTWFFHFWSDCNNYTLLFFINKNEAKNVMKNNITSSPTCMEDCHFLNSCHICSNNTSVPHSLLVHSSPHITEMLFIELIFGGGWCILGETALENSLQSNKLVDRKHESTNTLYGLATNSAITVVTSTQAALA